jgi:hypothetical protein
MAEAGSPPRKYPAIIVFQVMTSRNEEPIRSNSSRAASIRPALQYPSIIAFHDTTLLLIARMLASKTSLAEVRSPALQ